jgi:hypothetical protein
MRLRFSSLALIAGFLCGSAAYSADWRQGTLVNMNVSTAQQKNGKPAPDKIFTYSVDGGDKVYEAQEVAKKAPHVEVNSPVSFSVSKDRLLVRDAQGKVHKLALVKTTLKGPPPPAGLR